MKTTKYIKQVRKIDIIHIKQYLERSGWCTVYYNTPSGDRIIEKLKLENTACKTDGFVYQAKGLQYVFINGVLREQEKLLTLIHESAHIVLHHDLSGVTKHDEAEAWNFAYKVVHIKTLILKQILIFVLLLMFLCAGFCISNISTAFGGSTKVYVTPAGSKYHKSDCYYIKGKKVTVFDKNDVKDKYEPCSHCMP